MPRRLLIAGIVITGVGLVLLAYLDPVLRILFFGQAEVGAPGGSTPFTGTGTFTGNLTGLTGQFGRGGAGATSLVSVATILVFVVTVVGLLLTIAGSFATGKPGGLGLPGMGAQEGEASVVVPATAGVRERMRIVIS